MQYKVLVYMGFRAAWLAANQRGHRVSDTCLQWSLAAMQTGR